MNWLQLIGSLAAVFALAAMVWFLGMGKTPRIADADEAERLARDAHSGFVPNETALSRDGLAALVAAANGELVLLRGHGAKIVARALHTAPPVTREDGILVIDTGERLFGNLRLDLGEEQAIWWHRALSHAQLETADE
jgi:hypothetical protein